MLRDGVENRGVSSHPPAYMFPDSSSNMALEKDMVSVLNLITTEDTVAIQLIGYDSFAK
jgi:hypothetical protein